MVEVIINNVRIGVNDHPFIISEMSGNHNQSLDRALEIVEAAAKAGANALKLQTYKADTVTLDVKEEEFFIKDKKSLWKGKSLHQLYTEAHTPWEWHEQIMARAHELGMLCFSTPFDETALALLEKINCPFYKISSFEMTDIPLIKEIAKTKKPVIISTGLASLKEITQTIKCAKKYGIKDIIILYCVSSYPAKLKDFNLKNITILKKKFKTKARFNFKKRPECAGI